MKLHIAALALSVKAVLGQSYYPPAPEDVITVKSRFNNNITITYKEVCPI